MTAGFNDNLTQITIIWKRNLAWGILLIALVDWQDPPQMSVAPSGNSPGKKMAQQKEHDLPFACLAFGFAKKLIYSVDESFWRQNQRFQASIVD